MPDFEACGDLVQHGAHCANFITPQTRMVSKEDWEKMRFGRLSISPHDFAAIKAAIEKLCASKKVQCVYEQRNVQEIVDSFSTRLEKGAKK